MKLFVKYDVSVVCLRFLEIQLKQLNLDYTINSLNEISFKQILSLDEKSKLKSLLSVCGITIIENDRLILVQKIKDEIIELVWNSENYASITTSSYLSEKLLHSYGYLSNIFTKYTFTTIENFIIFQKIERVKQMTIRKNYTLTEISYLLNYSSVAHLSNQFKKTTGLTHSTFEKIILKRKEIYS